MCWFSTSSSHCSHHDIRWKIAQWALRNNHSLNLFTMLLIENKYWVYWSLRMDIRKIYIKYRYSNLYTGFIHFFVEQNQGLSRTKITVFKHLFLSIFIYKTLFNLTFLQVKMPVPSQENDGCPMSVVGNVKTFVAALCFMNIWAISELAKTFFFCLTLGQRKLGFCLTHGLCVCPTIFL